MNETTRRWWIETYRPPRLYRGTAYTITEDKTKVVLDQHGKPIVHEKRIGFVKR